MSVDLVDLDTGEAFIGLADRRDPPDFGVPFEYEHNGRTRRVKRVPSIVQSPIVKNYATVAVSQRRWHPAFEKHTDRGYGVVQDRRDVERVLDRSKALAKREEDILTWDEKD